MPILDSLRRRNWNRRLLVLPFAILAALVAIVGGLFGFGFFTFTYAQGFSYMSDDPAACANCHVMRDIYDSYNRSSHKGIAACNDCHVPHDPIGHYALKAYDGWKHSKAFTLGEIPEPIRIEPFDKQIALGNCLRCHGDMTSTMNHQGTAEATDCLRCHTGEGHR